MTKAKAWLEVKYGNPHRRGALLCRVFNQTLLRICKEKILRDANIRATISEEIDDVLGIHYRGDFEKLKGLLNLLIPDRGESTTKIRQIFRDIDENGKDSQSKT